MRQKQGNRLARNITGQKDTQDGNKYKKQVASSSVMNRHGILGKFFGRGKSAENNIAGIIAVIFALAICGKWLFCGKEPPNSFVTLLSTIVAYLLGYRHHA